MKLIGCFNTKGGVGKTTLNLLIGKRLAKEGYKILFIDADSQCNLTEHFYKINHNDKTMYNALVDGCEAEDVIIKSPNEELENIDIIPAEEYISNLSESMANKIAKEKIVAKWIKKNYDVLKQYDYIIIDLSPSQDLSNRNFLYFMDSIIYVVEYADVASVRGARKYISSYEKDLEELDMDDTTKKAILVNCMQNRKSTVAEHFEEQLRRYCEVDNNKMEEMLLESRLNTADAIKRSIIENVDLEDITKNYRSKKIEKQFNSIMKELKDMEVL